jgi:Holliday junction DNA helicase RuvA
MIGYLKGKIVEIDFLSSKMTVEVNSIGYIVNVTAVLLSEHTLYSQIELYTQPEVREDAFELFGFKSLDEKYFFKKLRSVNGIGPKSALNLMNLSIMELSQAIESKNTSKLTSIPGLGKKTAERLILELNGNLPDFNNNSVDKNNIGENIIFALENFGYKKKDILAVLDKAPKEMTSEKELIKYFLNQNR